MKRKLNTHPIFTHAQELACICSPLKHLNISYFAHVNITNGGEFTSLSNNPSFAKHYMEKGYYNADIHLASADQLGNHVIWDAIDLDGKTKKLNEESIQFGVSHVFTIIQEKTKSKDFYHFASDSIGKSINQEYLRNIHLLKMFISQFSETINSSRELHEAYKIKFSVDEDKSGFSTKIDPVTLQDQKLREHLFKEACTNKYPLVHDLSKRENECLALYASGSTAKEISINLGLSIRSIENYIYNIKIKLGVSTKAELIYFVNNLK